MVKETPRRRDVVNSEELLAMSWLKIDGWQNHVNEPNRIDRRKVQYTRGDLTTSQGNPWKDLGTGRGGQIGGDFQVWKKTFSDFSTLGNAPRHFSTTHDPMAHTMEHWYATQHARFANLSDDSPYWPSVAPSSWFQLDAMGTTAISKVLPTEPVFNAAAFVGELREGLPKAEIQSWKSRTARAKGAGSDYLNYQFGWVPLVADVRKFGSMVKNCEKILNQYVKDSGKLLHRNYDFPSDDPPPSVTTYTDAWPVPLLDWDVFDFGKGVGELTVTTKQTFKVWFEGTFTYVLPPEGSLGRKDALVDKLIGHHITPDVLWELTPWSWAVDWVSNAGDIAKNVSAFVDDGLVMPYAYIMEHKTSTVEYQLSNFGYRSYPGKQVLRQVLTTEVKTRRVATPYGFGLELDGFTPRQLAIMAALAATRGRR